MTKTSEQGVPRPHQQNAQNQYFRAQQSATQFVSTPIAWATPLAALDAASMYRCCIALAVSLARGHVIGFRFYGGVAHTVRFAYW